MKVRFLSLLLALVLLVAMLPAGAVTASAAGVTTASEDVIACIKELEGFRSQAYISGGQWSIGYGTSAKEGDTITREEADLALREHLEYVEAAIQKFATRYGLSLNQGQFDALACFSYNCGILWMNQTGRLRDAITKGATEEQFLFAISLWANNGASPDPGLLSRRMAEADMYLNGIYNKKSSTYTYTIFDANGGTPGTSGEDKMQGYRKSGSTDILVAAPKKSGYEFAGWYTQKNGGTKVEKLTSATAGKTLYAQYHSNGSVSEDTEEVVATGYIDCTTYVNIRKAAGTGNALVGKLVDGTKVEIYEITTVGGYKWGRISKGWICMEYVDLDEEDETDDGSYKEGTVTTNNVNVRSNAGTQYGVVTQLHSGTKVKVYQQKSVGSLNWGRIGSNQWICMAYVRLNSQDSSEETDTELSGKVSSNTALNVRSGPGTIYQRVDTMAPGSKVTVYQQKSTNGTKWGRIGTGRWVCMDYITLDGEEEDSTADDTGKVTASLLNVRSGPGTAFSSVKFLSKGTTVKIYEYKTANNLRWGRIGTSQWVCMSYVSVEGEDTSSGTGTGKVISTTYLNVRSGAGTSKPLVARLAPGTKVSILEQTKVNGTWWGKTSQGWVCMDYIDMGTSDWE